MDKNQTKQCSLCGKKMLISNAQQKKEMCEKCSTKLKKARAEFGYHKKIGNHRRLIYWHNVVKAMEATRKGVKL